MNSFYKDHIYVFLHRPIYPISGSRQQIEMGTIAYFPGHLPHHEHLKGQVLPLV